MKTWNNICWNVLTLTWLPSRWSPAWILSVSASGTMPVCKHRPLSAPSLRLRSAWLPAAVWKGRLSLDAPSSGWRPCPHPAARSSSSTQCLSHGRMRNLPAAQLPLGLWHFLRSRRNCNVWQLWRRCVADIWKRLFKKQSHIYFTQITVFPLIVRPRLSLETPDCIRQRLVLETRIIFGTLLILE